MYISSDNNSFNFIAPSGAAQQVNEVNFPYIEKEQVAPAAAIALEAKFAENVKDIGTITEDTTVTVAADAQLKNGARIYLKVKAPAANKVLTFGTGFTALAKTLTATKTYMLSFILIDGSFVQFADVMVA